MGDNKSPLEYQYLGASGDTGACMRAMIAILTSPYRPRAITAVLRQMREDQTTTSVCFVVWDWIGDKATLISDGFGTHHGEGGRGLATVIDMIQFYDIPLQEFWAESDQFRRIAYGHPTRADLDQLRSADAASLYNLLSLSEFGLQLWLEEPTQLRDQTPLPHWLMVPELIDILKEVEHNSANAVFQAARRLETVIREVCQLPAMVSGELLLNQALSVGKPLELKGATTYETQSWFQLFEGVIGAFKEPHSQREQTLEREDALAQILTINLLLRKLRQDYPEKFPLQRKRRRRV